MFLFLGISQITKNLFLSFFIPRSPLNFTIPGEKQNFETNISDDPATTMSKLRPKSLLDIKDALTWLKKEKRLNSYNL